MIWESSSNYDSSYDIDQCHESEMSHFFQMSWVTRRIIIGRKYSNDVAKLLADRREIWNDIISISSTSYSPNIILNIKTPVFTRDACF